MGPRPPEMLPAEHASRHTDGCKITPYAPAWTLGQRDNVLPGPTPPSGQGQWRVRGFGFPVLSLSLGQYPSRALCPALSPNLLDWSATGGVRIRWTLSYVND